MAEVHVELSRRAECDLRSLTPTDCRRVVAALTQMFGVAPLPANADDRALTGRSPWRRLRIGELRVLYRELTAEERPEDVTQARRTVRIVHRGDLHRAAATLA